MFQIVARQRRLGQPIGNLIHEWWKFLLALCSYYLRHVEDEPFSLIRYNTVRQRPKHKTREVNEAASAAKAIPE